MDMIREWIITILSIIIFVTFVEFLLPNSNHRRYINVIIGLLIMLVILRPLMGFVRGGISLSDGILQASNEMELMTLNNRLQSLEVNNQETMIKIYKANIKEQMTQRLEKQLGFQVKDIDLAIEESAGDNFGTIKRVEIHLYDEPVQEEENSSIKEVQVNVTLSGKSNNNLNESSILLGNEGEIIVSDFSSFYQISRDSIKISVHKNR